MKTISLISVFLLFFGACENTAEGDWRTKADQAIEQKDYKGALAVLFKELQNTADNPELYYYIGEASRQLLYADGSQINNTDPQKAEETSAYFERVIELSPKYTGKKFVVGPYTKIMGIWGALAVKHAYDGNSEMAKNAFLEGKERGGFYPSLLEYNKNIMASCAENAILFTNGDNDTYPMWYLQTIENFRPDITVLNVGLLNVPWFIHWITTDNYLSNPLETGLTDEEVAQMQATPWQEEQYKIETEAGTIEWLLRPTIEGKLLRVQDNMIIELISSNFGKRPLYFSSTVYSPNKIGLDDYLRFDGLVFKLVMPEEFDWTEALKANLMEVYTFATLNDPHVKNIEELKQLLQNYRHGFLDLTAQQIDSGKLDEARATLNRMEEKVPEEQLAYSSASLKENIENLKAEID